MTAELLVLLDSDPAAGILAAADLRERRADDATPGPWWNESGTIHAPYPPGGPGAACHPADCQGSNGVDWDADGEHIAAEANPEHARAAVRRWRGVVGRHYRLNPGAPLERCGWCNMSAARDLGFPCPDVRETADEARAYLGGAS